MKNKAEIFASFLYRRALLIVFFHALCAISCSGSGIAEGSVLYLAAFCAVLVVVLSILGAMLIKNKKILTSYKNQMITLSAIYKSAPDLLISKDTNGAYTSCSPSYEKFAGLSEAQLIGKTTYEIFGLSGRLPYELVEMDKQVLREGATLKSNKWLTYPDGSRKFFEAIKIPLIQDGNIIGLLGVLRDITELKKTIDAMERDHEQARIMLDTIPLCCLIGTRDVRFLDCNEETIRLFEGKEKQEILNNFDAYSPKYQPDGRLSAEAAKSYMEKAFIEGRSSFEWMHQLLDGSPIPAHVTIDRVAYGGEEAVVAYIRDMRESKKMSREIETQNNLLEAVNKVSSLLLEPDTENFKSTMLKSIEVLAQSIKVDRVCIWQNYQKDGQLRCFLAHEWPGVDADNGSCGAEGAQNPDVLNDILYEDMPEWEKTLSQRKCIGGFVSNLSLKERGHLEPLGIKSVFIMPVFAADSFWGFVCFDAKEERVFTENEEIIMRSAGQMIANAFIRNDMTQNLLDTAKQLKSAVEEANEANLHKNASIHFMESILNSIDSMIYVTDPATGEILFINDSMKRHYEIEGDCVGKLCYKILQKDLDERCEFCPCFHLEKEPDKPYIWEEHSTLTNRIYRNVDRLITWPNGQTVHLQNSVDTTELVAAKELAEQSSRYKSAFLANMSHEIRTPMNAILGIAEIHLQDDTISAETEEAFNKIHESGGLLLNIINDILDLTKIEAGRLELVSVKYDISSLINDTVQLNCLRYESKPIRFIVQLDENTPLELFGDELRIKQILNNIISNAFKYTDQGKIELKVSAEPDPDSPDDSSLLFFRVSDTGQGMTEEQIGRLFEEYTRFNLEANRTIVGAGLGMSITNHIVNLMNGKIIVESTPNEGSVFTICIPQKRSGSEVCGAELSAKLRNFSFLNTKITKKALFTREHMPYGSVLVVDDIISNIYVTKGLLQPYGLNIETVTSGFDAIEKIKSGNVYDIIFMDHMMPLMDGIETVKNLRELGYTQFIVALTANALVGQEEMYLKNGFDGFISKPIDSRELNVLLNEHIRNKKPLEIVEAARKEQHEKNTVKAVKTESDPKTGEFFAMDAESALKVLRDLGPKIRNLSEKEMSLYIITVHGIKSALANIGEKELSGSALKMEKAGTERNIAFMTNETPGFINALQSLLLKYKAPDGGADAGVESGNAVIEDFASEEDRVFLREKLLEIKTACLSFDKIKANAALEELKLKTFPHHIDAVLGKITLNIFHSAFKKTVDVVEKTIAGL